jgi:hypothetical protein
MGDTTMEARELLKELHADRDAYLATFQKVADALSNAIVPPGTPAPQTSAPRPERVSRLSVGDGDSSTPGSGSVTSPVKTSIVSGEDEDASDDDEALYVQDILATKTLDDEHLRSHLRNHKWNGYSKEILKSLFTNTGRLKSPQLFATLQPNEEGAHYSFYQVFDVGNDGTPLPLHADTTAWSRMSKDEVLWHLIRVSHQSYK